MPLSRRQLLQLGTGGLGLVILGAPRQGYAVTAVPDAGRITGRVRYGGQAPGPQRLKLSGDCAYCRKFALRAEELLVGRERGLKYAVVFLEQVRAGKAPATEIPTLAERRCTFEPHVLSITKGQKLRLLNDDPVLNTFHAVHLASSRTLFNIGMPIKGQQALRRVRQSGVIKMLCDVHPWEVGFVLAFDHPYHAVTDAQGRFSLEGVPPGAYVLGLWHETLGAARQQLQVKPGQQVELEHVYPPR